MMVVMAVGATEQDYSHWIDKETGSERVRNLPKVT